MPTYQYACTECGHAFEQFQSFSDDSLTVCPVCEGRLRKVFNAVGVVFKGSGFYRTDSRSSSSSTVPAKSDSSSAAPRTRRPTSGADPVAEPQAVHRLLRQLTPRRLWMTAGVGPGERPSVAPCPPCLAYAARCSRSGARSWPGGDRWPHCSSRCRC